MYTGHKVTLTLTLMISTLLLFPSPVAAEDRPFMFPFVFASAGGRSAPKEVQLGAGVNADVVFRKFGAGAEIQGFTGLSGSPNSQAGALFATNGLFLFAPGPNHTLPFAIG